MMVRLLVAVVAGALPAAASVDNKGTDFYVAFLTNLVDPGAGVELHLTADAPTTVTVQYPVNSPTFTTSVAVNPGAVTIVSIPSAAAQAWPQGTVANNAVRMSAPGEFVAYLINRAPFSSDAGLALPIDALNTEYVIATYGNGGPEFAVVAPFDNTHVTITPKSNLTGGFTAGTPFTIQLNRGEGFLGASGGDLTGSTVIADRPVSVTNGVRCVNVPQGTAYCDHIFEVAQPVQSWGTRALVTNVPNRPSGTVYRILASQAGTTVRQDGVVVDTIDRGEFVEVGPIPDSHVFEGDKPVFVVQYMTGSTSSGATLGDPAMGNMVPAEQYLDRYTFATLPTSQFPQQFLTVIAETADVPNFRLDGAPAGSFTPIGATGFSSAVIALAGGTHSTSSARPHGITVEGFGSDDSYMYPGGALFEFINPLGDPFPPLCSVEILKGPPLSAVGTAQDNRPTEDANGNGEIDPGEDANGNNFIDKDKGIFRVELDEGATNLVLTVNDFVPGDGLVGFHAERLDENAVGLGTVIVTDGAGNRCQAPIQLGDVACAGKPDGTPCGDGNVCNGEEICLDAACTTPSAEAALACNNAALVAFVSTFDDDALALLATAGNTLAGNAPAGNGPWGVAVRPDGLAVYVTNREGGALSVIDPFTRAVTGTLDMGPLPLGVAVHPTGTRLYVASYASDRVLVVDVATLTIVKEIAVGTGPTGLALNAGGTRLYVANYAGDTVSVIDTASNTVVATVPVGSQPLEMALDEVRNRLYVANYASDTVSVIGAFSNTVLTTVRVGSKPFGVATDGTRGRAFVTNAASDTVSVLDTGANVVIGTVPVGRAPFGIDVDLAGARAYVANAGGGTVSVIDTASLAVTTTVAVGQLPIAFGRFLGSLADCPAASLGACDDADPFTTDVCAPTAGCQHAALPAVDGVTAGIAALSGAFHSALAADLGGPRTFQRLEQLLASIVAQLGMPSARAATLFTPAEARAALGAKSRKRLKRANRALTQFVQALERGLRRHTIQRDLGWRLLDLARATQTQVRAALAGKPRAAAAVRPALVGPRPLPPSAP
jgi:YVTN family beta-propeller protein